MNERTNVTPRASHASRVRKLRPLTGHQRRRHPEKATYLTADNQMTRKPNLALNGEIEKAVAERLTGPEIIDPRAAADWENTE